MDRDVNFDFQTYDPGYPDDSTDVHIAVVEDNVWGFGQVVAVALLAAPLFIFFESIYGKCERFLNTTHGSTSGNHTKIVTHRERHNG